MREIVLIGGMGRSGTALVRWLVGSHSKIAMPPSEFKFFNQLSLGSSVAEILSSKNVEEWGLDLRDLKDANARDAFVGAIERYCAKLGKQIPGEKTPGYEFHYEIIREWLSDYSLKFIHMIRNPGDVLASFKYFLGKRQYLNSHALLLNWRRSASLGAARQLQSPEEYKVVMYERLANHPKSTLLDLCQFLEVEPEINRMLSMQGFPKKKPNTSFPSHDDASKKQIGKVRPARSRISMLSERERHAVDEVCGELGRALGYEAFGFIENDPYPIHMSSGREKILRFWKRSKDLLLR